MSKIAVDLTPSYEELVKISPGYDISDGPSYILAEVNADCPEGYNVIENEVQECKYACAKLGITKFISEDRISGGEICFINGGEHCSQSGKQGSDAKFVCKKRSNLIQSFRNRKYEITVD